MGNLTPWSDDITSRVKRAIDASDFTWHKVAIRAGIPKSNFDRRLRGFNPWDTAQIEGIARALDIDPSSLIPSCNRQEAQAS